MKVMDYYILLKQICGVSIRNGKLNMQMKANIKIRHIKHCKVILMSLCYGD